MKQWLDDNFSAPAPRQASGLRFVSLVAVLLGIMPLAVGGCADSYRRSADRQVQALIRDREKKTVDYTPEVEATVQTPLKPPKSAYAKIPTTPLPPATMPSIEPSRPVVEYGPLGPSWRQDWPTGIASPTTKLDYSSVQQRIDERLQLGPPRPGKPPLRLDLFGALAYAAQHSRQYQSQMESLYLAALDVTSERHLFAPRPFARSTLRYTADDSPTEFNSALTIINRIGVSQRLPYGGQLTAEALMNFVHTIDDNVKDSQPASVALTASIPLLRDAGMVNLEPLIDSERSLVYAVRTFENFRRSFAVNVASAYFSLLAQQQQIANSIQNLNNTRLSTDQTQALYAAGIQRYIEVQNALQSQLRAENTLVQAQDSYQGALDDFKLLIGAPTDEPIEVVARELAVEVPRLSEDDAVRLALEYRLDLQTAEDQVADAQRGVQNARNGLLPDLDLVARANAADTANSLFKEGNADAESYSADLTLDLPIDRVLERNAYRRSLISLERARRNFEQLSDQVAADVRDALRGIFTAETQVRIQLSGVQLAQQRLENATELLRQGNGRSTDVIDAQDDLLSAQNSLESARARLQTQILRFLRDTGTLRLDPQAGTLGRAFDRQAMRSGERPVLP